MTSYVRSLYKNIFPFVNSEIKYFQIGGAY